MASYFSAYGCKTVAVGTTGRDAIELARECRPDVLIMDPFLPYYNCDEIVDFLELSGESTPKMVKIAVSGEKNDRIAERFMNKGGDLFLCQPLDFSFCLKRMAKYLQYRHRRAELPYAETPVRFCTRKLQMRMKMPASVNGFLYIQDAVELAVEDPRILSNMVDGLYAAIAERHNCDRRNIERCIRSAVEQTFTLGDLEFLNLHFAHAIKSKTGKSTNREFIGILAELVRIDLAENF